MGFALSLLLLALGAILVAHHRIPPAIQPEVIAGGAVLIVAGLAGLALSARIWSSWGGPLSFPRGKDGARRKSPPR